MRAAVVLLAACLLVLMMNATVPAGSPVGPAPVAQSPGVTITYLYDNTAPAPDLRADWGFACLIESRGARILFDTGAKPEVLAHNAGALHVNLTQLDAVVLSHDHGDHTAGFPALGQRPGVPVFYAQGFNPAVVASLGASRAKLVPVSSGVEVSAGIRTSDEFGTSIKEEALLIDTPDGLVVVVGCAHPGIVPMLTQIKASSGRPIHAVVGGFHLLQTPPAEVARIVAAFQELGVSRVGATHCTGPEAIKLFKETYGDRFISGGVGTVVTARR